MVNTAEIVAFNVEHKMTKTDKFYLFDGRSLERNGRLIRGDLT